MGSIINFKHLAENRFPCSEFRTFALDQWCNSYLCGLERTTITVKGDRGPLQWSYRGRVAKNSLSEALGQGFPGLERNQYLFLKLDNVSQNYFEEIAMQLAQRAFPVMVLHVNLADVDRHFALSPYWIAFECALFSHGLQKHPAYYDLSGQALQSGHSRPHYGCYTNLASADCGQYDLNFLSESRDLHFDMLRDAGSRSDAHIMRYHFAAKRILAEVGHGTVILDACCGMGYGSRVLHQLCNPSQVTGVDIDPRAVDYASATFGIDDQIVFRASDLLSYLQGLGTDSLDVIVMFEGLEHVDQVEEVLAHANRVLKPSGIMISSVPNSWINENGNDENPWHVSTFDWDNYRALLSRHLALDTVLRQVGDRINDKGKWYAAEPCFEPVDIAALKPEVSEWWLAICRPRSIHVHSPQSPFSGETFELKEALVRLDDPDIKVVSFDIFDTLLSRPTIAPVDVFYILQHSLVERYGELFSSFAALRGLAEKNARQIAHQKGLGDITYDEIYGCLAQLMTLDDGELQTIKMAELDLEKKLLKPRLGVKKLYDRALELGKRVIIISDMYLSRNFLNQLLSDQGYKQIFQLWVSSEYRIQKRTGLLFEKVLNELSAFNISPHQVLHIGDNEGSDIHAAARHGMQTLHTPKATERYVGSERIWLGGPKVADLNMVDLSLRSFVGCQINSTFHDPLRSIKSGLVVDCDPYLFGRLRMAPFIYFAMNDFLRRCVQLDIRRVLFATRDGHVTKEVFKRIASQMDCSFYIEDLEISRTVLNLLQCQSLGRLSRYVAMRVVRGDKDSLLDLLVSLTGESSESLFAKLSNGSFLLDPTLLSQPMRVDRLGSYLMALKNLWPLLEPQVTARAEAAIAYVRSRNIDETVAIWDIGYFHSVAKVFAEIDVRVGLSSHLIEISHHQSRVSWDDWSCETHSFIGAINNTNDKHPFTTDQHSLLFELLLGDPSTASRSLFSALGDPIVQPETIAIQKHNRERLDAVHKGIIDAVDDFHDAYGSLFARAKISPTEVLEYSLHARGISELLSGGPLVFDNRGLNYVSWQDRKLTIKKNPV